VPRDPALAERARTRIDRTRRTAGAPNIAGLALVGCARSMPGADGRVSTAAMLQNRRTRSSIA
jgi:hypothetical protein